MRAAFTEAQRVDADRAHRLRLDMSARSEMTRQADADGRGTQEGDACIDFTVTRTPALVGVLHNLNHNEWTRVSFTGSVLERGPATLMLVSNTLGMNTLRNGIWGKMTFGPVLGAPPLTAAITAPCLSVACGVPAAMTTRGRGVYVPSHLLPAYEANVAANREVMRKAGAYLTGAVLREDPSGPRRRSEAYVAIPPRFYRTVCYDGDSTLLMNKPVAAFNTAGSADSPRTLKITLRSRDHSRFDTAAQRQAFRRSQERPKGVCKGRNHFVTTGHSRFRVLARRSDIAYALSRRAVLAQTTLAPHLLLRIGKAVEAANVALTVFDASEFPSSLS